jgi:hypothetical protein
MFRPAGLPGFPWFFPGAWVCFAVAMGLAVLARAAEPAGEFRFGAEPAWVSDAAGFEGMVRVDGLESVIEVTIVYTYPGAKTGAVAAQVDEADRALFHFKLPPAPGSGPGHVTYHAEAVYGPHGTDRKTSGERTVPLSLTKELDITGEAAKALLYPLGGAEYTVRYVPCCNIYGGVTVAERVPVNPAETAEGLPATLLSDFIVLTPDGLSASTMGMYFDFALGADRMKGVRPALYEFNGKAWTEFHGYEVDLAAGRVSMHCPEGGTFVVGVKK